MTDDELKELVASIAIAQKGTDKELSKLASSVAVSQRETDKQLRETAKELKELASSVVISQRETDKQLKELGKQIGGLGRKFGSFTEGLALPSMEHILRKRFNMEVVSPSVRAEKAGKNFEIDVLAYANSSINEVYVVEVKSHLREEIQGQVPNCESIFTLHQRKMEFEGSANLIIIKNLIIWKILSGNLAWFSMK